MILRQSSVTDEYGRSVPGATIYVYDMFTGGDATLTSDGVTPLAQPVSTDEFGIFTYWADEGIYREDTWFGGKLRFREANVILGTPAADLALRADLAASGGGALVDFTPTGIGAVRQSVQSKLREIVSVKDFGAVGDGVDDDTAAIQAAIDAVGAAGGGIVTFPRGTYKITSLIVGDPDVTIDLTGAVLTSAIVTSAGMITADTVVAARTRIVGGTMMLTGGNENPFFFNIAAANCEIAGVRLVKTPEAGGYMCYFRHNSDGLIMRDCLAEGSNGIFIEGSGSTFINNRIVGRAAGGDDCFAIKSANESCRNISIVGNYIENMSNGVAIGSEIGYSPPAAPVTMTAGQIVFANNTLKNCSTIAWIKPGSVAAYDYRSGIVEDVVVSNNILIDETGAKFERGIVIAPSRGATVRRVYGRGNIVRARTKGGTIRLRGALDIFNVDARTVIHFNSGGPYVLAVGNVVTGATSGATGTVVAQPVTGAAYVLFSGSFVDGNATGYFEVSGKAGAFVAENLNVGGNLNVATVFGDAPAPSIGDIDIQVDFVDPWNGVANGAGGAPGFPATHVAAVENQAPAYGAMANIVLDIRGNGSAEAGLFVGAGLTAGAVRIDKLRLTQVNVTNAAGQGGAYLLSDITLGTGFWSVTPAAGTELAGAGAIFSQITSKDSGFTATGAIEAFPSVPNVSIDVSGTAGRVVAFQTGTGYRDLNLEAANILFRPGAATTATVTAAAINLAVGKVLQVNGVQVIGPRVVGWAAATNTKLRTTFDTTTVTLPQLAARVGALIDDLIAHGVIGP